MQVPQAKLAQRRLVRPQAIGHDLFWLNRLVSQQTPEQPQSRISVSPSLNDDVQNFALIIDRAPQEHPLSPD
jgi:hypothetical protein